MNQEQEQNSAVNGTEPETNHSEAALNEQPSKEETVQKQETAETESRPNNGYSEEWNQAQKAEQTQQPAQNQNNNPNQNYNPNPNGAQNQGYAQNPPYGQYQNAQQGQPYGQNPNYQQNPYGNVVFGAPAGYAPYGYYAQPEKPKKKKKERKPASRGAVITAIVLAILLPIGTGIGGAFLGAYMARKGTSLPISSPDEVVIQHTTVEGTAASGTSGSYTSVYEKVSDSVVEIRTESVTTSSIYGQYVTSGAGSGVIISKDGYIVTCAHVVEDATAVTVTLKDGTKYDATVVGSDSQTDIAVIKIEGKTEFTAASFGDSDSLVVGQEVVALGNPLGTLGGSMSNGIISATNREITIDSQTYTLLQTNTAINPGNSGGGLFDMNGLLVGVVNAKSSGDDIEGIGFAIPSVTAEEVAAQLIANGYVKGRPMLGVSLFEIQSQEDYYNYWKYNQYITDYGIYVAEAINEAFEIGDRIVAFNGTEVSTISELKSLLSKCEVGEEVTVTVSRNKTLTELKITLTEMTQ